MKTREQERMALAFRKIDAVSRYEPGKGESKRHEYIGGYGTICMDFPILVRTAGLCQAVMFVHTRGESYADAYLGDLDLHLRQAGLLTDSQTLLATASKADLNTYMLLTREVLACALWMRRFAQSILKIDPTQRDAS